MTAPRPPIVRPCTICGHNEAHYYVVLDRERHLCWQCWRTDTAMVLDTLNIPMTPEEEDPCPPD